MAGQWVVVKNKGATRGNILPEGSARGGFYLPATPIAVSIVEVGRKTPPPGKTRQ